VLFEILDGQRRQAPNRCVKANRYAVIDAEAERIQVGRCHFAALRAGEVHVWLALIHADPVAEHFFWNPLSDEERQRAEKIRVAAVRADTTRLLKRTGSDKRSACTFVPPKRFAPCPVSRTAFSAGTVESRRAFTPA